MSRRSAYTQELSTTQKCSSNVTCSHHDITHYSFDIKQQTLTRSLFIQFSISNIYISTTQTYHRGCIQINTTGATSGEGTAYISGTPEFTPVFSGVRQCYSIFSFMCNVLQIVVCPFVLFILGIVLSVLLRFMDFDYPFGIYKDLYIVGYPTI